MWITPIRPWIEPRNGSPYRMRLSVWPNSLEIGERTRFKLGATTLLFVNLRERNVAKAGIDYIQAQADFSQSLGPSSLGNRILVTKIDFQRR